MRINNIPNNRHYFMDPEVAEKHLLICSAIFSEAMQEKHMRENKSPVRNILPNVLSLHQAVVWGEGLSSLFSIYLHLESQTFSKL